jgi:hypothetical protein
VKHEAAALIVGFVDLNKGGRSNLIHVRYICAQRGLHANDPPIASHITKSARP